MVRSQPAGAARLAARPCAGDRAGLDQHLDDVEHCLKADTSPHLAEQLTGNRDFLTGTLNDVIAGRVTVSAGRPVVFSPFGLGVLDLAVGRHVYDRLARDGDLHIVDEFFNELRRHG